MILLALSGPTRVSESGQGETKSEQLSLWAYREGIQQYLPWKRALTDYVNATWE